MVDVPPSQRTSTNPDVGAFPSFVQAARQRDVRVLEPASPNLAEFVDAMKRLAPDLLLAVGYSRLLGEGLIQELFDAGFIITAPGCGGCASGQVGMTGEGEVQISTSNRNFLGKQGQGRTYLASPITAAAAAVAGRMGPGVLDEVGVAI